jgi:hypothetical protein
MNIDQLKPNLVLRGALFPEPVQVITTIPLGQSVKLMRIVVLVVAFTLSATLNHAHL